MSNILRISPPIPPTPVNPPPGATTPPVTAIQVRIVTGTQSNPATWTFGSPTTLGGVTPGDYPVTLNPGQGIQARCINSVDPDPDNWSTPLWRAGPVVSPVNPTITTATFTAGTPATLTLNVNYTGADLLRVILATRNGGSALTPSQMQAGTGTFIETFIIDPFTNATVNLDSAFTSASNAATAIDILALEANNGGVSSVSSVAVSGLNFGTGWATTGGNGTITITSQPAQPAAPTTTGGNGSITITG